jgi:hypothetical protein
MMIEYSLSIKVLYSGLKPSYRQTLNEEQECKTCNNIKHIKQI